MHLFAPTSSPRDAQSLAGRRSCAPPAAHERCLGTTLGPDDLAALARAQLAALGEEASPALRAVLESVLEADGPFPIG